HGRRAESSCGCVKRIGASNALVRIRADAGERREGLVVRRRTRPTTRARRLPSRHTRRGSRESTRVASSPRRAARRGHRRPGAGGVGGEGEGSVLEMTSSLLRAAGYRPREFTSGEEALEAIRRDPPDLVLVDILLEGMSGVELCREIRKESNLAAVPVILVSG